MKNQQSIIDSHLTQLDKNTIVERVKHAAVVGAGGAGFPTYVKLQSEAETFWLTQRNANRCLKSISN